MHICLGISGSIAAYRSVDFVKRLVSSGHEVRCILTRGGQEFVSAKVLETFSKNPVLTHQIFDETHFSTDHISVARWADCVIVYGATANFIGRLTAGLADDFLTLQLLAFRGPVILAPAMNPSMWTHPTVNQNVSVLQSRGYLFAGPISGKVACGEEGLGHLTSDEAILALLKISPLPEGRRLPRLDDKKILISAGPMRTSLDPIRYIQNRSSGKMGLALAKACQAQGASSISVLLGPVSSEMKDAFAAFEIHNYVGPQEYETTMNRLFPNCDIFFSTAAVLDFECIPQKKKIPRSELSQVSKFEIEIRPVPDIVGQLGARKAPQQQVIAFAVESGTEAEILERARLKMTQKSADAMIVNPAWPGVGPESDDNQVWILKPGKDPVSLGPAPKEELGISIIHQLFSTSS